MRNREKLTLTLLCAVAYFVIDAPVQLTGILPSYAGIKNFLPSTLGLFFGVYGAIGCVIGCVLSAVMMGAGSVKIPGVMHEVVCVIIAGMGMFHGWHFLVKSGRISFKTWPDYGRYSGLLAVLCVIVGGVYSSAGLRAGISAGLAYFLTGLFIGVPVSILFSSLLYIEPVMPKGKSLSYDADFCLLPNAESLEGANEILEMAAMKRGVKMKRVLEIQSCIEELALRIQKAHPDARISVSVTFGDAISARIHYGGEKYNPFRIDPDEDEIDIMSLAIIKHRAIRASFSYSGGENQVHAVV
ncbi:MAG: hypothetical protein IJR63_02195 [Synergistaceae bacterium]|nr:hypothetical protein [Synergistaceae bacterium]